MSAGEAARLIAALHADGSLDDSLVVGGQAIQFWADYFGIAVRMASITRDLDLFGTRAQAQRAAAQLSFPHTLYVADLERATPNSAQLEVHLPGQVKPVVVAFLMSVAGLRNAGIRQRAATVAIGGTQVRMLHPLDCLASKMFNLKHFPEKRTPEGVEQGRLAIEIAQAFVGQCRYLPLDAQSTQTSGKGKRAPNQKPGLRESARKTLLKAVEMIHRIATTPGALFAYQEFGLDCMHAISRSGLRAPAPAGSESLVPKSLLSVRIAQMEAHVAAKRDAARRRRDRLARVPRARSV